ncbi:MAG: hypothetical protein Q8942_17355 [Bacillota bacterium]|nr:hypothetical protein [Bacillota bacterium]
MAVIVFIFFDIIVVCIVMMLLVKYLGLTVPSKLVETFYKIPKSKEAVDKVKLFIKDFRLPRINFSLSKINFKPSIKKNRVDVKQDISNYFNKRKDNVLVNDSVKSNLGIAGNKSEPLIHQRINEFVQNDNISIRNQKLVPADNVGYSGNFNRETAQYSYSEDNSNRKVMPWAKSNDRDQELQENEIKKAVQLDKENEEKIRQEILRQERIVKERLEQEKLNQERQQKELMEKQKNEEAHRQERLIKERILQEKLNVEKLTEEKLKQERLNQQRLNEERINQERLNQERLNEERLNQERINQERTSQERTSQERINQERIDQERLNQERLNKETLDQERFDQERLDQERLNQELLEQERLNQERLNQQRLEKQRLEQQHREVDSLDRNRKGRKKTNMDNVSKDNEKQEKSLFGGSKAQKKKYQIVQTGFSSVFFGKNNNVIIIPYAKDTEGKGRAMDSVICLQVPIKPHQLGEAIRESIEIENDVYPFTDKELLKELGVKEWDEFTLGKRYISIRYDDDCGYILNTTSRNPDGSYRLNCPGGIEKIVNKDSTLTDLGDTIFNLIEKCKA